jgi:alkylation response protein AidB-like acyl-CoA dehydrogenase
MDLALTQEQSLLLATTRHFLDREVSLNELRERSDHDVRVRRDYWIRAAELGWTSMLVSEDQDAPASTNAIVDLVIVAEEAGRALQSGPLIECNVVAQAIERLGSSELRASLIPGLCSGSIMASWAMAERSDGWDASNVRLSAKRDGTEYVLNGAKASVCGGVFADVFLVSARLESELAQFIVRRECPGLTFTSLPSIDLSRDFCDITFDNVKVSESMRLGADRGDAAASIEDQWLLATTLQCAEMAGMLEKVFDWTLEYMKERYAFGRPIASYQALKHRMADHKVWIEAALGLSTGLTRAVASGDPAATEIACVAKSIIGDHSVEIISDCAQMFGGISMTWEHDLHLYLRRATVNRVLYGSPIQLRERLCSLAEV